MTPDEITRMAREAGMERIIAIEIDGTQTFEVARIDLLERFAALVAAHVRETEFKPDWAKYRQGVIDGAAEEREACAEICACEAKRWGESPMLTLSVAEHWMKGYEEGANSSAEKIRARGGE